MRISDWSSDVCSSDLIAAIRFEAAFLRFFQERDGERLITTHVGHFPRLGGIGDIAVGQEHDRGHVAGRKPASLDSAFECVRGRSCCDHWQGRIAVAAIHCLIKVRLLSFRRKPGRGAATLRSEEHTSELQSLMRNSYAVFCLNK